MSESNKSVFWSKTAAAILGVLVVGGGIMYAFPNEVEVEVPVNVSVPGETVYVDVPVDSGNLSIVLDHLYDNIRSNDSVNYLTDDLDDDEVEEIVDRIVFINEIKKLATDYVDAEMADELDKVTKLNVTFDEDDIERIKVKDDAEDVIVADIDFEDSDADLEVKVDFEQDDIDYTAIFNVEIKDGEVDDMSLLSVS